ncbi:PepSY-associated TM helix domain-containing protein [Shewanella cyperi]|uniref:PepSY-associated TM helix domain-containing protein n=1 Tax=Shewanella cyperi TaxID=2814292 RepID=UPI001A94456A|nr:PepSY-associated TM helix domain-containing protein [Shewanella cyperi]QSX41930.1 PepSY domain-containing protein [Shewanella cyperi]
MITHLLRKLHLWLALVSAVFVLILSLTGSLLVFGQDIEHGLNPGQWTRSAPGTDFNLDELLATVTAQTDTPVRFIQLPEHGDEALLLSMSDGRYINLDPDSGTWLKHYKTGDSFYGFMMQLHRWLAWTTADGKRPLQDLVSLVSLLLMLNLLFGMALWLKPKARLKRLKVKFSANPRIVLRQLHGTLGILAGFCLLLIAFSGMAFHWQGPTQFVVEALAGESIELPQAPVARPSGQAIEVRSEIQGTGALAASLPGSLTASMTSLELALTRAQQVLPGAKPYRIYPATADKPVALRMQLPGETHANSWVWLDPYSAEVLGSYDASRANLATRIWHFRYKFHTGDFWHGSLRWLWLLLSLLPAFFCLSGLYLYWRRQPAWRPRQARGRAQFITRVFADSDHPGIKNQA